MDPKTRLVDGNAMFRKSVDPTVISKLAKKQEPFMAILSCSDSRVSPEKIFNLSIGDAFIVRTAGNSAADPTVLGSLEYAVAHLHVRAILVLGHTDCGAVRASFEESEIDNLQKTMRDMESARFKLDNSESRDPDAVAEGNVRLQLRRLEDQSMIIGDAYREEKLALYGAIYELPTGSVRFVR
jgi:carbonic anhydrase